MGEKSHVSDDAIYSAVAARRVGFDTMAWQVPIISLTAQAFLFTIALGADSTAVARTVAAGLSVLVSALSIVLMARHRQADIADAKWLLKVERSRKRDLDMSAHSDPWRKRRDETDIGRGFNFLKKVRTFYIWELGLLVFLLVGAAIIPVAWVHPEWLSSPTVDQPNTPSTPDSEEP